MRLSYPLKSRNIDLSRANFKMPFRYRIDRSGVSAAIISNRDVSGFEKAKVLVDMKKC